MRIMLALCSRAAMSLLSGKLKPNPTESAAAERQVFERCKMPRMCLLLANAERNSRLDLPLERVTPERFSPRSEPFLLSQIHNRETHFLFLLLLGESVKLIRKRERI